MLNANAGGRPPSPSPTYVQFEIVHGVSPELIVMIILDHYIRSLFEPMTPDVMRRIGQYLLGRAAVRYGGNRCEH